MVRCLFEPGVVLCPGGQSWVHSWVHPGVGPVDPPWRGPQWTHRGRPGIPRRRAPGATGPTTLAASRSPGTRPA